MDALINLLSEKKYAGEFDHLLKSEKVGMLV